MIRKELESYDDSDHTYDIGEYFTERGRRNTTHDEFIPLTSYE